MGVWTFALAAFFSLPKQFATVYIGVIIEGTGKSMFVAFPWVLAELSILQKRRPLRV